MTNSNLKNFISGYSIEVVPNSAAKVESFAETLPANTRVWLSLKRFSIHPNANFQAQ